MTDLETVAEWLAHQSIQELTDLLDRQHQALVLMVQGLAQRAKIDVPLASASVKTETLKMQSCLNHMALLTQAIRKRGTV